MGDAPQRYFGYERIIALAALILSALYFAFVVIPDIARFNAVDIWGGEYSIPILYAAVIMLLAIAILKRNSRSEFLQQAICGVLEGALLAYSCVGYMLLINGRSQWSDGTFRWGVFYVGLFYAGIILSGLGAGIRVICVAVRRRRARTI